MTLLRIDMVLTLPPSFNRAYDVDAAGGRYLKKHYREWKKAAGQEVMAARAKARCRALGTGRYGIRIRWPEEDIADIDNRIKALLDLLRWTGTTPDDKWCRHMSVGFTHQIKAPQFMVRVWRLQS